MSALIMPNTCGVEPSSFCEQGGSASNTVEEFPFLQSKPLVIGAKPLHLRDAWQVVPKILGEPEYPFTIATLHVSTPIIVSNASFRSSHLASTPHSS